MKRDRLIEMLRVVAAFLIIWYHARTIGSEFAYSGLVIFIILSMNFEAGENIDRKVDVIKLALRLLIPWVFWCLVYAILDFARRKPVLDFHNGVVGAILTGSSFHLWYLPFIFVVMVSFGLLKAKLASRVLTLGATALALAMIGLAPYWRPWSLTLGTPVAQWLHGVAPVAVGVVIGSHRRGRVEAVCLVVVLAALAIGCFAPYGNLMRPYLVAAAAVVAVLFTPEPIKQRLPDIGWLSGAMFGVYLAHPLAHPLAFAADRVVRSNIGLLGVAVSFLVTTSAVLAFRKVAPKAAAWIC